MERKGAEGPLNGPSAGAGIRSARKWLYHRNVALEFVYFLVYFLISRIASAGKLRYANRGKIGKR